MNSQAARQTGYWPFLLAVASGLGFVLAFYPFGWGWTGWLAPIGVLSLVMMRRLPGRRPWLQIWLGCFVCWLALFQCVRLPHWAGYIGWPFLSAFLGSYLFLFVVVGRQLVHGWKVPVLLAAPVAWVGLEYIQAHFCTGISLGMLSHTQAEYPLLIQVADLAGCYTVSFFMVAIVTAAVLLVWRWIPACAPSGWQESSSRMEIGWAAGQVIVGIAVLIGYGTWRLRDADEKMVEHPQRIALIQGSIDTRFPDESELREYLDAFTRQYSELSREACEQGADLVIWPETMFPVTDFFVPDEVASAGELDQAAREQVARSAYALAATAHLVTGAGEIVNTSSGQRFEKQGMATPILAGASSAPVGGKPVFYNSAILIDETGEVVSRYGKMKLVLFGEFVPLGDVFPWLYQFFPIPPGLRAWDRPVGMEWNGFIFSPSICFESTYPHLLRSQFRELEKQGRPPDVLVNVTNDGWFYGSTALDLHFANTVFRAVENRTPVLIAANTGFSGQIDSAGRVLAKGPRREAKVLSVNLVTSEQTAAYHHIGDWPAFLCFLIVLSVFFSLLALRRVSPELKLGSPGNLEEPNRAEPEK